MKQEFFEWLDSNSPTDKPYSKEIYDKYVQALEGNVENPFQWRAVLFALETQFSKAAQKTDITSGGKPIPILNAIPAHNRNDENSGTEEAD